MHVSHLVAWGTLRRFFMGCCWGFLHSVTYNRVRDFSFAVGAPSTFSKSTHSWFREPAFSKQDNCNHEAPMVFMSKPQNSKPSFFVITLNPQHPTQWHLCSGICLYVRKDCRSVRVTAVFIMMERGRFQNKVTALEPLELHISPKGWFLAKV